MYKQLKQVSAWASRKRVLLFVLFFSIILRGITVYYFTRQYNPEGARHSSNMMAYASLGTAIFFMLTVFYILLIEIHDRKKINNELRIQKELFRITIDSIGEGLITTGKAGEILYMNAAAEKLTGWSNTEAKDLPLEKVYDVVNEESGKPFEHIVSRILKKGRTVEFENNTLLYTKQRNKLIISNTGSPLFDEKGDVSGTVLLFNDITEKKKIENELKEKKKGFRDLIENLPEAVYTCDASGYIKLYNRAAVALWGREPEIGKERWAGAWKILSKDGKVIPVELCPMAIAVKEGRPVHGDEIMVLRQDGSIRHVLPYPSPIFNSAGELTGAVNMLIDVTEKREREILIKRTEEKYGNLIEQAADGIFLFDQVGNFISANTSGCTMLGYAKAELLKLNLSDITPPKYLGKLPVNLSQIDNGTPVLAERQYIRKDGTLFCAEVRVQQATGEKIQAIIRDITDRKNAQEKIKRAVERYDILARATSDTIWDWDIVLNRMLYNEGIVKMFGYEMSEVQNVMGWWKQQIHPDDIHAVSESLSDVFNQKLETVQLEYRFRCEDGSYKYIFDRAFVIFDEEGRPSRMIGSMQDVTHQKMEDIQIAKATIQAQEDERQQLGLELHDNVNQILVGALLSLGMTKQVSPDQIPGFVEKGRGYITYAINEIRKLSHRLIPASFKDTSLQELFGTLIESVNIENKFTVEAHFDDMDPAGVSDDIQINLYRILQEQLNNIVKHAHATTIKISITLEHGCIILWICDNGKGFDPRSEKNGIGLRNIKKRSESFNGKMLLNTSVGNGCELLIEIPLEKDIIAFGDK